MSKVYICVCVVATLHYAYKHNSMNAHSCGLDVKGKNLTISITCRRFSCAFFFALLLAACVCVLLLLVFSSVVLEQHTNFSHKSNTEIVDANRKQTEKKLVYNDD